MVSELFCFVCFTSSVSLTGFYTEDEPSCLCFPKRGLPFVFTTKNPHHRLPKMLHWYACGPGRWAASQCTVTWLPNFLRWVVYHIFLPLVLCYAHFASKSSTNTGLEKYQNSTLPIGQVTLKFCLSDVLPLLPKFSNSLIIHEPKDGSHA